MEEEAREAPPDFPSQLTREDVLRLAHIQGLPITDSDVDEVRYRLNALAEALARLDSKDLARVDPLPLSSYTEDP